MSEFITIQVGQCGNQIGGAFWPSVLEEYGFLSSKDKSQPSNNGLLSSFNSFFSIPPEKESSLLNTIADLKESNVKARSILVDMEESVISRYVRRGALRDLFDDKSIITNHPGSGNNWAEGYCSHGPYYQSRLLNATRRAVEKCDSLQGFILMFSVGGGTGSGLGSYILELLEDNFSNIERFVTCVYPTGSEDVITCPYNMALATKQITNHANCVFPVENRALLDIVTRLSSHSRHSSFMFYRPQVVEYNPFQDMNALVVNMLMHLTSSARFQGSFNVDFNDISTNMVPFPNMHFLASSYSPFIKPNVRDTTPRNNSHQLKDEMFRTCCTRPNQLLKLDPLGAKSVLLGATLIGRGDFNMTDMRNYVDQMQLKGHFTSWSRKSFRTGLCDVPPSGHNSAILCLFNTSSVALLFGHILDVYKKLYKKKAHVHHYTKVPGFDLQYFEECENSLLSSIESYKQIENNIV